MVNQVSDVLFYTGIAAVFASYLLKLFGSIENLSNENMVATVGKAADSLKALN